MNQTTVRLILADLVQAQDALHESSRAFDSAMSGLRVLMDSIAAANHAQGTAIDAVATATKNALLLFDAEHQ